MKKFLFFVFIAYRLGAMESEELVPEFRVPPIVMQIARRGARQFGLTQLPLICKVDEAIWPNIIAMANSKQSIERSLAHCYPDIQVQREPDLRSPAERFDALIDKLFESPRTPQKIILLFPQFFNQSYGVRKALVFHELWHIKQYDEQSTDLTRLPLDPSAYPRGIEQEADMRAAYATNCHVCAYEFATRFRHAQKYVTKCELLTIAHVLAEKVCPYHEYQKRRSIFTFFCTTKKSECQLEEQIGCGHLEP